jgi:hypothetical protein
VLSFLTLDAYALYWFYQNWKIEKKRTRESLWPLARTVFAPLTAYFLFDGILTETRVTSASCENA